MPAHALAAGGDTDVRQPDVDDVYLAYLDTLRDLGNQGAAVNTALLEAHTADSAAARRRALTELHTRLRQMAATTNQVLGHWPDPETSRP